MPIVEFIENAKKVIQRKYLNKAEKVIQRKYLNKAEKDGAL